MAVFHPSYLCVSQGWAASPPVHGAETPHTSGDVLRSREEANGALYDDHRGTTGNATGEVEFVRKAEAEGRRAYVLVNNRSEGNAPLTVQALAEMLRN